MIQRMKTLFSDLSYMSEERKNMISNKTLNVNVNAFTLVISSMNKLYAKILELGEKITTGRI